MLPRERMGVVMGGTRGGRFLVLGIVLLMVACGGDDEDAAPDTGSDVAGGEDSTVGDEDSTVGDDAGDDGGEASLPDPDDFDFGTGIARVTIGDTTYEFDLSEGFTVCRDVFGGLQVAGNDSTGEANVDMWIPPEDWESYDDGRYDPPAIIVEDDALNARWIADSNRVELISEWPPESRVDSYSKSGDAATGSATFVDDYAFRDSDPVEGTFEVSCEGS